MDVSAFQMLLLTMTSWLDQREREVLAYLIEENRVLRRQLGGRRLRLTDDDRRTLAARAYRVGRQALREVATIVTPDTLLRWHRQLIARKWTNAKHGPPRRGVVTEIRELIRRMAGENPSWGYTRIQGALTNLGHRVGRSTIARVLRTAGIPPAPERRTSWQRFLRSHWGEIAAADFFTTEVWTLARPGHVLYGLCDRPSLAASPDPRLDATSRRDVHGPDRAEPHGRRRRSVSRADLRPGCQVE